MKTLILALVAVFTLMTTMLKPEAVSALSGPNINLGSTGAHHMVFMTKKSDAQAKKIEGRIQSASGDLTGNNADKIKGAAKQVQGSAMNTAANMEKGKQKDSKTS